MVLVKMKFVIADPKNGKCFQVELDENKSRPFYKEKIGSKIDGSLVGLAGYQLEITGGSDKQGFPMRKDVHGTRRKKILLSAGTGFKKKKKGERRKKTVCGNRINENIAQINLKVTKFGDQPVAKILGKTEGPKKEEVPKEGKATEEKTETKAEEKPEPKKEEVKEEPKVEKRGEKPEEKPKAEEKPEKEVKEKPVKKEESKPVDPAEKKVEKEQKPEEKK